MSAVRIFYTAPVHGADGVSLRFERDGKPFAAFVVPRSEDIYKLQGALLRVADHVMFHESTSGSVEL